jgi:hypothetical protein
MDNFYEVSEDTIEEFMEIFNKKTFPTRIEFLFIGNSKQKDLIKITKIPDDYSFELKKELKVTINEDLMIAFDDESRVILIEQELDKVSMHSETGKIKLVKSDLNTFSSLVNKYGIEKVARANKVEELYQQQKADQQQNDDFLV